MRTFAKSNAAGLSLIAFSSYFDVYSHSHIFIGTDPWWNPAHFLLYAGFAVIIAGLYVDRPGGAVGRLSAAGVFISIGAAVFNEVWHRVLLFGNPLPEPFPVEPPHAVLAVGIIMIGVAALLYPYTDAGAASDAGSRVALAFIAGSLWLVVAGSAFYVGGAYGTTQAYLFAVGAGSFASSLFVAYSGGVVRRFGYATLSYSWFLAVNFVFFLPPTDWLPLGLPLLALLDLMLTRAGRRGEVRLMALALLALLYGVVYFPILPVDYTLAVNEGLIASIAGVGLEFVMERVLVTKYLRNWETGRHGAVAPPHHYP